MMQGWHAVGPVDMAPSATGELVAIVLETEWKAVHYNSSKARVSLDFYQVWWVCLEVMVEVSSEVMLAYVILRVSMEMR